jgi:hypothetical protein
VIVIPSAAVMKGSIAVAIATAGIVGILAAAIGSYDSRSPIVASAPIAIAMTEAVGVTVAVGIAVSGDRPAVR